MRKSDHLKQRISAEILQDLDFRAFSQLGGSAKNEIFVQVQCRFANKARIGLKRKRRLLHQSSELLSHQLDPCNSVLGAVEILR